MSVDVQLLVEKAFIVPKGHMTHFTITHHYLPVLAQGNLVGIGITRRVVLWIS